MFSLLSLISNSKNTHSYFDQHKFRNEPFELSFPWISQ
jgi:hypothetical protein